MVSFDNDASLKDLLLLSFKDNDYPLLKLIISE